MTVPSRVRVIHIQVIFSPEHGGPTFALANYRQDHCLVVADEGDREYVARCLRRVRVLAIEDRCLWLGQVNDAEKG